MRIVAIAVLILGVLALLAGAQVPPSPPPLTTIAGRIVDEDGRPVANARVAVPVGELGAPVVLTDAEGAFSVSMPQGHYPIDASKPGYASTHSTAVTGNRIQLRLRRGAVLAGRVVDEYGDPVPGIRITAATPPEARPEDAFSTSVETDDLGEFRVPGLAAGSFVVWIATPGNPVEAVDRAEGDSSGRTYYPGVTRSIDAERLKVEPGEERSNIDFTVPGDYGPSRPFSVAVLGSPGRPPTVEAAASKPGTIRGQVLSTEGRALAFALVRLMPQNASRQSLLTRADSAGRFEFSQVPAGTFRLLASKVGYIPGAAGDEVPRSYTSRTAGRSIDLAAGDVREGINLKLARWSTMSGRVLDEHGDPVQGASVQLLQPRYERGRRRLIQADGSNRRTDERGRYRIYAIAPGQYIASAVVGAVFTADLPGYVRSYSPATANAGEARIISIGAAQDVTDVDVMLVRVPTASVAGQLLNAAGEPSGAGSLTLIPSHRSSAAASVSVGARILRDGRFEFPNVAPGEYVIQASRGRASRWNEGEFAALRVTVNGDDIRDLVLQTLPGSSITGYFRFETADLSKRPAAGALELVPQPADPDLSSSGVAVAEVGTDWTFRLAGINGPRRLQLARAPAGWTLDRVLVNGIDITDQPLLFGRADQSLSDVEVVLTDRLTQVSGRISDDHDGPAARGTVIVFSPDEMRWYTGSRFLRNAAVRPDGGFTITGLAPATYYAAAVAEVPNYGVDEWQDPEFLRTLVSGASTLTLAEGQTVTTNLRLPSR